MKKNFFFNPYCEDFKLFPSRKVAYFNISTSLYFNVKYRNKR